MRRRQLVTGPALPPLETRVFDRLADRVSGDPESVLYLAPRDHPEDATRTRWREVGPSAALRVDTFDGVVTDCYEHDEYDGQVTHVDRPLLARLVELGVEGIASPNNPLSTGESFPSADAVREAEALFTDLEFAGLLSPAAMRDRLVAEGLPDRAGHVEELAASVEDARERVLADELAETFRTERMDHVTRRTALDEVFPSVEAVVLGGHTRFDELERRLVDRLVETWPTVALLPLQRNGTTATGLDAAVDGALTDYLDRGFEPEFHGPATERTRRRSLVTRGMYRHPGRSPDVSDLDATDLDLLVHEPTTVSAEVRAVARDLRRRLGEGVDPGDVGVVLTDPGQYAPHVREVFETYDLPFGLRAETPLPDTALGDAVRTACRLAREPRTVDALLALLTNPLVRVDDGGGDRVDHRVLARVAARAGTNRLDTVLDHADDLTAEAVDSLLRDVTDLTEVSLDSLPEHLTALLDRLGVAAALDGDRALSESVRRRERSARDRLDRVLETLALTEPVADREVGDSLDRLERALHGVSVGGSRRPREDRVAVYGLSETTARSFERVYVLGLTAAHVPSNPDRTAFARPISDAHRDFTQRDVSAEARYRFGGLLASDATLHLSVPQRSSGGEPYVETDVVTELRRVLDLSAVTVDDIETPPGCVEDVQREIGGAVAATTVDRGHELVSEAAEEGTVDDDQRRRLGAGLECAAARASPALTPYDGQLSAETVSQVHGAEEREPYSPSRLETYAACGFKYYVRRVLGIESPDPIAREPDAGARGSYVHDVLEHYYRSLQTKEGGPVAPADSSELRQERLLEVALERLDDAFDGDDTAFHAAWLTEVLAGLGTPETNPYYGERSGTEGAPAARGLLARFLEHEATELAEAAARPTWFEARVGNPHDTGTPIQSDPAEIPTPDGPVPVHGIIDRVETVPATEPTRTVVRDYKTGRTTPSERDTLLGLAFQLPLYGLLAEDALRDAETVGGAYYQVSPPTAVNSRKGLLTSDEMATWHGDDDVDVPLLRHSYPHFDTHAAFRRFLTETVPARLGTIASAVEDGRFHPTVLDPDDAGCRYCDYADVCDVRPHQRRDVVDAIDATDTAYVPPKARGLTVDDVGVE